MKQSETDSCGFGLLVNLNNKKSSSLIKTALSGLARLSHRGAVGEDGLSGDGCGILIQLDKPFFQKLADEIGVPLKKSFAVGMCFLNRSDVESNRQALETALTQLGCQVAGWRPVPLDLRYVSISQQQSMPCVAQIFVNYPDSWSLQQIERTLFVAKNLASHALEDDPSFTVCSLSTQTIVYKATVLTQNLPLFYPDLHDRRMRSALALFHQRFSTNTLPSWRLAQPFAILAHNGEINTIQGNRHYAQQISHLMVAEHFPELSGLTCLVNQQGSDSLSMDNMLESLVQAGMSGPEALRLMVPEVWEKPSSMSPDDKEYYRYHAHHLPPWEGPAGLAFFDGRYAGCLLDRNGFRPARVVFNKNGWIGIGSEVGIFDFKEDDITHLSRLQSGEMVIIDMQEKTLLDAAVFKARTSRAHPYADWMSQFATRLDDQESPTVAERHVSVSDTLCNRFDVSFEEQEQVLRYMSETAEEPTSSMGDDTPMAALSAQTRQLFDFFRQQFAQVTNPPIDSLRESCVMSAGISLGTRALITRPQPGMARQIELPSPLLSNEQMKVLSNDCLPGFVVTPVSLAFEQNLSLKQALDRLCDTVQALPDRDHQLIILSDETSIEEQNSIHPTLAAGALHHALIKTQQRGRFSIVVRSGWVRDAHHLAILIACGADAVNPWLGFALVMDIARQNQKNPVTSLNNYRKALNKGLLKIASKMGVCTLNAYRGSQLFHVIGLDREVTAHCFSKSSCWLEKYDWQSLDAHQKIFYQHGRDPGRDRRRGGLYKFLHNSEYHDYNPDVVTSLLRAVTENDARYFQQFKELVNCRPPVMVRDFLSLSAEQRPVSLNLVEDISTLMTRFDTAAMSLGALSPEAHEALAVAMNRLGGRSNSGEGGEARHRQGQINQSKIRQVASARFGVTAEYLMHAEVLQIKIAQGAKPGEGGQLPGTKVNALIAGLRYCSPGVTLISPPPHHDIYSIEDLAQLIFDLKQINPKARVSVKLVSAPGIGTIAAGVVKAYADMITISGYDGGTGASPLSSIRYTGCPWEFGLSEVQRVLMENNLRHRVTLQVDGGLKTGLDVIKAAILGAESFGFGTAPMIALGCKYLRICHLNNCATGVATQDERLRSEFFHGLPERVMRYFRWLAEDVRELLASLGLTRLEDAIGRLDLLAPLEKNGVDVSLLLRQPEFKAEYRQRLYQQRPNVPFDQGLYAEKILDDVLPAIQGQSDFTAHYLISNDKRSIGANVAGVIARQYGNQDFPARIRLNFHGIAGQSFGAWLVQGLSLYLEGAANDYVAKGMSGGELIITPFRNGHLSPASTCLAGNTCLYGATGGICYLDGLAGQRFAVRNSGATAIVLGVGDHACEYMTAGSVAILSSPGNNFAAGMTGGVAFVYDDQSVLTQRCNQQSVGIHLLDNANLLVWQEQLMQLLQDFHDKTHSVSAASLLSAREENWNQWYLVLPKNVSPYAQGEGSGE
ncbi:glutamate synthase large subunit [Legionella sp. CNM-4043-24]|uniref:glutamate synthase large subunit n=1 Tax=Legionella sp. CNM-4043-24 TaxID=3421646 RepID=UPI00403A7E96